MTDYSEMTDTQLQDELRKESSLVAEFGTKQMAYKVLLNSCYGAL